MLAIDSVQNFQKYKLSQKRARMKEWKLRNLFCSWKFVHLQSTYFREIYCKPFSFKISIIPLNIFVKYTTLILTCLNILMFIQIYCTYRFVNYFFFILFFESCMYVLCFVSAFFLSITLTFIILECSFESSTKIWKRFLFFCFVLLA